MKGDAVFYHNRAVNKEREIRKLKKAYHKNLRILDDLKREIEQKEDQLKKDLHCYTVQSAFDINSTIVE